MRSVRRALAVAFTALGAAGPRAQAQDVREYERRVDSLAAMLHRATEYRIAVEDSLQLASKRHDSIVVGPVRLLAFDGTTAWARRALPSALSSIAPGYGQTVEALRRHTFLLRADTMTVSGGSPQQPRLVVGELDRVGHEILPQWIEPDTIVLVRVIVSSMLAAIGADVDPHFRQWLSAWLPRDTVRTAEWTDARIALLSSVSMLPRRCYDGVISACRVALGFDNVADPATQWFDSAGRRRFVADDEELLRRFHAVLVGACLQGSDRACIALIRRWGPDMHYPLTASLRAVLAKYAATLGGNGAMERMLAPAATPAQRLSAAARLPLDTLLGKWVVEVRRNRAENENMTPAVAATSIGWLLLCAGLVTRSSRWR